MPVDGNHNLESEEDLENINLSSSIPIASESTIVDPVRMQNQPLEAQQDQQSPVIESSEIYIEALNAQ